MRWHEIAEPLRSGGAPDASEEYFVYQTLVGAHPIEPERLAAYLEKALREAKRTTNWIEPDEAWEQRVADFALEVPSFPGFAEFAEKVAEAGHRSAMAQTLLKLTVPGVPDIYQGDELVTLSLVDPDNRRAVDWDRRRKLLDATKGSDPSVAHRDATKGSDPSVASRDEEKLALIVEVLRLRRERPQAFAGEYRPLDAGDDVCAFVRGGEVLVVAVLRDAGQDAFVEMPWGKAARVGDLTGGRSYAIATA
jgi:(1->4)-alpha-D-glucan 1-alpha-D-glucosylmutase